ncbi:probable COF1 - cofilin, actin binding and severing protein [Ustilago bromivora]|uniref:Cofilin n=3 Tax=Ustilago TaxID=5269 RepID=A0A8H8QL62_9BASI|nr:probable COF1 - cofilin, actin binding and severing protein [Ustilago bromivora]
MKLIVISFSRLVKMSSGVAVSQECLAQFQELKLGKKIKYIIYTLNQNNTEIVVAKASTSSSYDDFIAELPPAECRYAIYDFEYEKGDEGKRNKICFFTWSPDDAKIKQKMVFASSKDALRKALVGISSEIQGTDFSEVSYETVLEKVSRSTF